MRINIISHVKGSKNTFCTLRNSKKEKKGLQTEDHFFLVLKLLKREEANCLIMKLKTMYQAMYQACICTFIK